MRMPLAFPATEYRRRRQMGRGRETRFLPRVYSRLTLCRGAVNIGGIK